MPLSSQSKNELAAVILWFFPADVGCLILFFVSSLLFAVCIYLNATIFNLSRQPLVFSMAFQYD